MKTSCCALSQILVSTCLLLIPISAHCFYNPSTGRWLSRDPVAEAGFEASKTTSSIYRVPEPNDTLFVWNCPIQMIDPNGLAVTLPGFGACPLCCFTCKPAKGPPAAGAGGDGSWPRSRAAAKLAGPGLRSAALLLG